MEENSKEMPQTENKKKCKKNCLFVIIIAIIAIVIAVVFFVHSYNDNDYYGHYSKEEKLENTIDEIVYPEITEEEYELEAFLDEDLDELIEGLEDEDFDF